jgi:hypothetical protein
LELPGDLAGDRRGKAPHPPFSFPPLASLARDPWRSRPGTTHGSLRGHLLHVRGMAWPAARRRPRADAWRSPPAAAQRGRLGSPPAAARAPCFRRARLDLRALFPRALGVARSPAPWHGPAGLRTAQPHPSRGVACPPVALAWLTVRSTAARSVAARGDPARPARSTPALPLANGPVRRGSLPGVAARSAQRGSRPESLARCSARLITRSFARSPVQRLNVTLCHLPFVCKLSRDDALHHLKVLVLIELYQEATH